MEDVIIALKRMCGETCVVEKEPMFKHTSFKTGGPADIFITPKTTESLVETIKILRSYHIPYMILGNGSNVLFSDNGFRGAIIQIYHNMEDITIDQEILEVQAGALLASISSKAMEQGLTGLEFASGIPGTFGGAICMNAGAYGGEMKDILIDVKVLSPDLEVINYNLDELELGYRNSIIAKKSLLVLSGRLQLKKGNTEEIKETMKNLAQKRREKQPLNFPSAGSTFKRPTGYFAGKLIEDAGLKGYSIGGAQVSEKHAGFIINKGGATTKDICMLIEYCQNIVKQKFGVELETEVKMIGE